MTTISADAARPIGADSFADLPGLESVAATVAVVGGKVSVTFEVPLTEAQRTAVWDRMTSRDDADQAARALLRAAVAGKATNLAAMTACAWLGDPMPAPTYPPA